MTQSEQDEDAIKEMIQHEIRSIPGIEERVFFKELVEGVFLSLYETSRQMYARLEQRVQDEIFFDLNQYRIKTGMIEKEYFDASHHFLTPMDARDLAKKYEMKDILTAVREEGRFVLMQVMICCDYLEIRKIWDKRPVLEAVMITDQPQKEWKIEVTLQKNEDYLNKVSYLYQMFIRNGVPWQTVNMPYLYKLADVVVTKLPEEIGADEKIREITVHFGEYEQMIKRDLIPVWNIQRVTTESIGFPVPCMDHKSYEHDISLKTYGADHAYLVEDDRQIRSISKNADKLRIICGISEARKWNIYMFRSSKEQKIDRYTYPVMQNGHKEGFSENCHRKWNQDIRTKTDLTRFINGFGMDDYLQYRDCDIAEQFPAGNGKETYSMNSFISDEIRNQDAQKKLVLYFQKGRQAAWLQRDVMSFLTSEVQRIYPEYDCGGILL